jgi:uncharacterized membrane protein YdfJ with MMPL/SSD domain
VLDALGNLALKRPWALLAANALAAIAAVVASLGAPSELGVGSTRLEGGDDPAVVVVLKGDIATDSRVFEVAEDVITAQVQADKAVANVERQDTGDGQRASDRVVLVGEFEDVSEDERQRAIERLVDRIDPGPLRVEIGGETAVLIEARDSLGGDLWRPELLVLPLVLLAMAASAGPRLLPATLLCTVTAVAGTVALMRLIGTIADVSVLSIAPGAVVGAVLGIELPAMVAALRRDEAALSAAPEALRRSVSEGGRRATLIAGAASLPAFGMLATPLDQAASLALGCALAAWLAAASALVATPALSVLLGSRARSAEGDGGDGPGSKHAEAEADEAPGWLRRLPGTIAAGRWRTLGALAIGLAALAALTVAATDGSSRPLAAADLPRGAEARTATEAAVTAAETAGSLFGDLPLAAAVAAALLALGALALTRRPGALLIVPAALLPAAAGVGACVLVFEQGHLADALDLSTSGPLDTAAVATCACALAAVGAARSAAALLATRAERRLGVGPDGAAELAGAFTLPAAVAATVAAVALVGALLAADLYAAKEFGFAVGVGLVLDLVLVRVPLLAALARWSH